MHRMLIQTRPLFVFDPGWLFILAGVALCAAGLIVPAHDDLRELQQQHAHMQSIESHAYERLGAYANFLTDLETNDPAVIRRLATAQLNLVPQDETPILLASSQHVPVLHWIDSTVEKHVALPQPEHESMLSRFTHGPHQLWLFGGSIFMIFIGLLTGPFDRQP